MITATTKIYTLSLHDALPISIAEDNAYTFGVADFGFSDPSDAPANSLLAVKDRKSTRLNSSHSSTSYAVSCLTKKSMLANYIPAVHLVFTHALNANWLPEASS